MSLTLDIKYAARLLLKKPAFTALTVLIVAVGLGLTLYTYSLLNSLVFKPLMLNGDEQIIAIESQYDHTHLQRRRANPLDLWRVPEEIDLISDMGIYEEGTTFVGDADSRLGTKKYNSTYTSWNVFEFAGVQPYLGRGFRAEDHHEGAEPTVVLGYDMWMNYFAGDETVVGTMVPLDAIPTRVIGVMPQGFSFPMIAEIWQPVTQKQMAPTDRSARSLYAFARLKNDATLEQLSKELDALSTKILATWPSRWIPANGRYLTAETFKKAAIVQYYTVFMAMFVVVFLILLLACINVGNLLLARVNERIKEIAIRVALGVPRKRLILQMLWESVFVCSIGGLLALLLAAWGLDISNGVFEQTFAVDKVKPFWWQVSLDTQAVWVLIAAVVTMIFITGFIPAWRALNNDFNAVLRDGTRGALGKKAAKASKVLVISEVLLSCVVLVMATILLSTSYSAGNADYGVETQNRVTAVLQLPFDKYPVRRDTEHEFSDRINRSNFYNQLKQKLELSSNIEAVSFMTELPGRGEGTSYFEIEGRGAAVFNENPYSNNEFVARDSWRAVGMKIIQGRDFDHRDIGSEVRSIIINESIATTSFPDGDAVGKRVRRANRESFGDWYTIIGVVSDTFHGSAMSSSSASFNSYGLMDNLGLGRAYIAMHYTGKSAQALKTLTQTITEIDGDVGMYHAQSYDDLIKQPMLLVIAVSKIFLLCGVIAVFLAASGIYAVAANSITQRTQEIGVRRALGSSDARIMRLFMKQAIEKLAIGLALGIAMSLYLVQIMTDAIVINNNSYIIGLIAVPVLIISMVMIATYIPTRKVVLMEPSDALHHE